MPKYQSKPKVVDAWKLPPDYSHTRGYPDWFIGGLVDGTIVPIPQTDSIHVKSNTGWQQADVGDWLIRSPSGEVYPCKDADFTDNYQAVLVTD